MNTAWRGTPRDLGGRFDRCGMGASAFAGGDWLGCVPASVRCVLAELGGGFFRGASFKDGKIYLGNGRSLIVIRPAAPMAWMVTPDLSEPRGVIPRGIEVAAPIRYGRRKRLAKRIRAQVEGFSSDELPMAALLAVQRASFEEYEYHALRLNRRVPACHELAWLQPLLCALMAMDTPSLSTARRVMRVKPRHRSQAVAEYLGLPHAKRHLRVFAKIPPAGWTEPNQTRVALKRCLADTGRTKRLLHVKEGITEELIQVLDRAPHMLSKQSIDALLGGARRTFRDLILRINSLWGTVRDDKPPVVRDYRSLALLDVSIREEVDMVTFMGLRTRDNSRLAEPPLSGTPTVIPVVTTAQLLEIKRWGQYCLGLMHLMWIANRESFFYHLCRGNKSTKDDALVMLANEGADGWRPVEIRGRFNKKPSDWAVQELTQWLKSHEDSPVLWQDVWRRPRAPVPENAPVQGQLQIEWIHPDDDVPF